MQANPAEPHLNDPLYHSALRNFQKWEWKTGLAELNRLMEAHPLDHELRLLRQEMQLRAKVDGDEREDLKRARQRKLKSAAARLAVFVVIAGLIFLGVRAYAIWFQGQLVAARQNVNQELKEIDLAVKFSNAQGLLQAGRPNEARDVLQQIHLADPDYPGLNETVAQAEAAIRLEMEYNQALQLVKQDDLTGALAILEKIAAKEPNYRDVSLQVDKIANQFEVSDEFTQAEQAFQGGDWEAALAGFETVQKIDPEFQSELIEGRLYESYVNAAEDLLVTQPESLEALQVAEGYFQKALALRPQDEETRAKRAEARQTLEARLVQSYIETAQKTLIDQGDSLQALETARGYLLQALALRPDEAAIKLQTQMAEMYLKAQGNFSRGAWDEAISALEFIYANDPGYALGTARQTLYEAYIGRGETFKASGEFDQALLDYQRAAVLALDDPEETDIRLYEAQLKLAEVQGILGNYDEAVQTYLAAIDLIGLRDMLVEFDPELAAALQDAESYAERNYFKPAYLLFREVSAFTPQYEMVAYEVKSGEYLTQLANRYNTTVNAIQRLNDDVGRRDSLTGKILLIPVPETP